MDILKHYCIQLDFSKKEVRFLDDKNSEKSNWGKRFPLIEVGDGLFAVPENLTGASNAYSLIDTGDIGDGWLRHEWFEEWTNQSKLASTLTTAPNGALGGESYHDLNLTDVNTNVLHVSDLFSRYNGIGLHVLSQNLVTLDFPKRTMFLKRRSEWPLYPLDEQAKLKAEARSASDYLEGLIKTDRLPGWSKIDQGGPTAFHLRVVQHSDLITFDVRKRNDAFIYHYTVARPAKGGSSWQLSEAWCEDQSGKIIHKFYPR